MSDTSLSDLLSKLNPSTRKALEDLVKNKAEKEAQNRFNLEDVLFDKQLEVFSNESKRWAIVASRRAGKSYFIAAYLLSFALNNPRTLNLYVGLTRESAKNVLWSIITELIDTYKLPCKANGHLLEIDFENKARILVRGAKDKATIERFRGMKLSNCVIDEAQSFGNLLVESLVTEIVIPALGDLDGRMIISGTPDPLCNSVLYKVWEGSKPFGGFERFHWSVADNKKFPRFDKITPEQYFDEVCRSSGMTRDDPKFKREYLGLWAKEEGGLVYGFNPKTDYVNCVPPEVTDWRYVISCDAGFIDSDAIIVCAYSPSHDKAYVVDAYTDDKQSITSFIDAIMTFKSKYSPSHVIIDSGGGGLKIVEEIRERYKVMATAAQKYSPKSIGCAIVASEFKLGRLKLIYNEEVEELGLQLQNIFWRTRIGANGVEERYIPDGRQVKGKENKVLGDDLSDALLYAMRYLKTYNYHAPDSDLTPEEKVRSLIQQHKDTLVKKYKENQIDFNPNEKTSWY
jgi:phage terminase large subunit